MLIICQIFVAINHKFLLGLSIVKKSGLLQNINTPINFTRIGECEVKHEERSEGIKTT